ncbi:RNA-directed DNA polymerase (reverse transcriptase) domain containing protein [Elysia marginata]|uniref:RNA-directed DNA polymerase (Reverse transcriptase) domain containing protein n=1 Tax=Elysia marginata TaxID=1093978 RepID=A0AAV4I0S8_9GAST|nr:RNA-directed DNA polymerase (reverse transcriptase) domain containing protein [Elysia marginata]
MKLLNQSLMGDVVGQIEGGTGKNLCADTEKAPPFTEREVEACLNDMSKNKAPGPDQITNDVYKLGGEQIIECLTKCYNNILETKTIPLSWNEAKIIALAKRETQATSRITGRSVFLPKATNSSPDFYKREWRGCWIEINPENKQGSANSFQQQTTYNSKFFF